MARRLLHLTGKAGSRTCFWKLAFGRPSNGKRTTNGGSTLSAEKNISRITRNTKRIAILPFKLSTDPVPRRAIDRRAAALSKFFRATEGAFYSLP
jgi:hypothetical protein